MDNAAGNKKQFLVTNNVTGAKTLVTASKAELAEVTAVGSTVQICPAEDTNEIMSYFKDKGKKVHPDSRTDGPMRYFFVKQADGDETLVRAKNPADVMKLLKLSDVTVKPIKPADLIDLLSNDPTIPQLVAQEKTRKKRGGNKVDDGSAGSDSSDGGGGGGEDGGGGDD